MKVSMEPDYIGIIKYGETETEEGVTLTLTNSLNL